MSKALNKTEKSVDIDSFELDFKTLKKSVLDFQKHDQKNDQKLYDVLEGVFEFGVSVARDEAAFTAFLTQHDLPFNKVTRANPYNALVKLAFGDVRKSQHSQYSNILAYARAVAGKQKISDWLNIPGGLTQRYEQSVRHFGRTTNSKTHNLRTSRLSLARSIYENTSGKHALTGTAPIGAGFYRSLVYSDGRNSYVVDIREQSDEAAIDKYLLELVSEKVAPTHPLAGKPLFNLYRAIDIVVGLCGDEAASKQRFVALWNETHDGKEITKVGVVSEEYSFTNAMFSLDEPIAALRGQAPFLLNWTDAKTLRSDFQKDDNWHIRVQGDKILLENEASHRTSLKLLPVPQIKLYSGKRMGQRKQHFTLQICGMQSTHSNIDHFMRLFDAHNAKRSISSSRPARFVWRPKKDALELELHGSASVASFEYPLITLDGAAKSLADHRELAVKDIRAICNTLPVFGEDIRGYVANSDTDEDAAFCIDHEFMNGDNLLYVSPMVISSNMDRIQVCEELCRGQSASLQAGYLDEPSVKIVKFG